MALHHSHHKNNHEFLFDIHGTNQKQIKKYLHKYPRAIEHILSDFKNKHLKTKDILLPNHNGNLHFIKTSAHTISITLEPSTDPKRSQFFPERFNELWQEKQNDLNKRTQKRKSLVQKGLNQKLIHQIDDLLQSL